MKNVNGARSGDFLIVGGEMDSKGEMVQSLRIQSIDGLNGGFPIRATRKEVVDALKENFVFLVSPELNPGAQRSVKIKMVTVSNRSFLRTDDKKLPSDFLGDGLGRYDTL